jgi:hypothetical protein
MDHSLDRLWTEKFREFSECKLKFASREQFTLKTNYTYNFDKKI